MNRKNENCKTTAYEEHCAYNVGYYLKCEFDNSLSYYASSPDRDNCIKWFVKELEYLAMFSMCKLAMNITMEKLNSYQEMQVSFPGGECSICGEEIEDYDVAVLDHDHFTGRHTIKFFFLFLLYFSL